MTVATTTNRVDALGNGSATSFSFAPVVIFEPTDLVVTIRSSTGVETTPTQGAGSTNFAVVVSAYPGTGSITYPASGGTPVPSGSTVIIKRIVPLLQTVSLSNQGAYLPKIQEGEYDYLTAIDQQQQDQISRCLQVAETDQPIPMVLPTSIARANQLLGFDSTGTPIAAQPSSAIVSSPMQPVVNAASTASALTLLGGATASSVAALTTTVTAAALVASQALAPIATVAALRAFVGTAPAALYLLGYLTGRDGGEGVMVYAASDTTSVDNGGTIFVDGLGRRWYRADATGRPMELEWFGGAANGTTDNLAAWTAAVTASGTSSISIRLRRGTYIFSGLATAAVPANATLRITGEGPGATILKWAANAGIYVPLAAQSSSFHLSDFSVYAGSAGGATSAISIFQFATPISNPANTPLSDIINVTIRGSDALAGTNYFSTGINILKASCINFVNVFITGASTPSGTGVSIIGSSTVVPVLFNFQGCVINSCVTGIIYGDSVQGMTINQCNFTFCNTGVSVPISVGALAQLAITGSQFNCYTAAVDMADNPAGWAISNNFILVPNNATGIIARRSGLFAITANTFFALASVGTTGINVITSTANGVISGNAFVALATVAINLAAGSSNVNVQSNSYLSCGTNTTNTGAANVIGGGSA